ncbi:MAG: heavy-metal-associated domain-containing protein [Ferruginibacter sp.]|nr:heavy-metal-associated domain-containing protein [Ferruginibacter sp.]
MKNILFIAALLCSFATKAQVTKVAIQASGLTCSMCSNAINKSLRSIDFVQNVDANIKTSTFEITFKPGTAVDFDKLKKKVEDAGFFVANFTATIHFDKVQLVNDGLVTVDGTTFHFLNIKDQVLDGNKSIQLIDKGYVTAKAYKANGKYTSMECYKTGLAAACCIKDGLKIGARVFQATI